MSKKNVISPLAVSPEEAAAMLGVGRTTTFNLIATGELTSFTVGRRRLVPVSAVVKFVEDHIADGAA